MLSDIEAKGTADYRTRIRREGRVAWPAIVALSGGGVTFVGEALLGWWTNWVDTGQWQADAFVYPFFFTPIGVVLTIIFSAIAGAGFGRENRILGILAGVLPLLGIVAMLLVTAIPGAAPTG
ncbi:MAG: hypothetical protein JWP75_1334 [Frondihabitans sp.]|nr:hypothetical protein [Frondihabitans sp.]